MSPWMDTLLRRAPYRLKAPVERAALTAARTHPPLDVLRVPGAAPAEATLVALGDLALTPASILERPDAVLAPLADLLGGAELRLANVEAVLSDRGERAARGTALRADPRALAVLTAARLDVVTCANNHILDYGPDAADDSRRRLVEAGIDVVGYGSTPDAARAPAVRRLPSGLRVAVLGYADDYLVRPEFGEAAPAPTDDREILEDLTAARALADVVVLQLHWGYEWVLHPPRAQRDRARAFADAGADVVICHHAHVPMGIELRGRSVIAHGLGNGYFRYNPAPPHPWRNRGLGLRVRVSRQGVVDAEAVPVGIRPDESVTPLQGTARREVLGALGRMSARLGDDDFLTHVERGRLAHESAALLARLGDAEDAPVLACFLRAPRQRALRASLHDLDDGAWAPAAAALDEVADAWDAPARAARVSRSASTFAGEAPRLRSRHGVQRGLPGRLP